jgi:hypothetical protein
MVRYDAGQPLPGRLTADWNSDLYDRDPPLIVDDCLIVEYWAGNGGHLGHPIHRYQSAGSSASRVPSGRSI